MARFSITDNAGKVVAFSLGTLSLASWFELQAPGETPLLVDVRVQFLAACVVIVLSFGTLLAFSEEPDSRPLAQQPHRKDGAAPRTYPGFVAAHGLFEGPKRWAAAPEATPAEVDKALGRTGEGDDAALASGALMRRALGQIWSRFGATLSASGDSPLLPLKDTLRIEALCSIGWSVQSMWGPLYFGIEVVYCSSLNDFRRKVMLDCILSLFVVVAY